jgi:hypothetical protein
MWGAELPPGWCRQRGCQRRSAGARHSGGDIGEDWAGAEIRRHLNASKSDAMP